MKRFRWIAVLLLLSAAPQLWAAAHQQASPRNIFESFHLLDQHFTRLDTQFHVLQDALASNESHLHGKRGWQPAAAEMRTTTIAIRRFSYRMCRRYEGRRTLGHQMFARLYSSARVLQARLYLLSRTPSQKLARGEETRVEKAVLDLVLQYQAVSGGYAAATCDAGAWSCGVPRKEPRNVGYPSLGVKWICVKRLAACHGILGPRSPLLAEPPLTGKQAPIRARRATASPRGSRARHAAEHVIPVRP